MVYISFFISCMALNLSSLKNISTPPIQLDTKNSGVPIPVDALQAIIPEKILEEKIQATGPKISLMKLKMDS